MTHDEYVKATDDLEFDRQLAKDKAWVKFVNARSKIDLAYDKAMEKCWNKLWVNNPENRKKEGVE